jgi:DNA-directed RNA polymerase subunit M/transcription elongation factor TFIIS
MSDLHQTLPAKSVHATTCPKCQRNDRVEEEDQSGSSSRWFVCERCGIRFSLKPRRLATSFHTEMN